MNLDFTFILLCLVIKVQQGLLLSQWVVALKHILTWLLAFLLGIPANNFGYTNLIFWYHHEVACCIWVWSPRIGSSLIHGFVIHLFSFNKPPLWRIMHTISFWKFPCQPSTALFVLGLLFRGWWIKISSFLGNSRFPWSYFASALPSMDIYALSIVH